ncbi:MAG: 4-hydroxy-tetrahydrodipicolinate synthase, partial [Deltaproteobacteria bacterium]|nr:4-hydroxy-tetrahydrodipicolinate synthase [Deltaproteobacteria bacterium]
MQYVGAYTALLTPFKNGKVDEEKYREFVEWQITEGIDGLVPCGTTGESATLTHKEHEEVIRICIDQVKKRVPVIAGAGSNNTTEAIRLTKFAKEAGADAALHITPYYNKPTQRGLFEHFKAIGEAVDLPLIVYNVPGRTSVNVAPATMARMFREIPNVVGVKEATGDMIQVSNIMELCGGDFDVLSGDDFTVLPLLALGGTGVISVVSNILPKKMAALCAAFRAGDLAKARKLHYEMMPISRACFVET